MIKLLKMIMVCVFVIFLLQMGCKFNGGNKDNIKFDSNCIDISFTDFFFLDSYSEDSVKNKSIINNTVEFYLSFIESNDHSIGIQSHISFQMDVCLNEPLSKVECKVRPSVQGKVKEIEIIVYDKFEEDIKNEQTSIYSRSQSKQYRDDLFQQIVKKLIAEFGNEIEELKYSKLWKFKDGKLVVLLNHFADDIKIYICTEQYFYNTLSKSFMI